MRTVLRRIAAGALAYVVSYVLIGLVTVPRLGEYLTRESTNAVTALDVYHSAGSPLWQAIGWFTLNANGVPIRVAGDTTNFVANGTVWLGMVHGWVGLIPMVACLLVGAIVVMRSPSSSPVPLSVGAYMMPGYLVAVLASTVVFGGEVGPVTATASLRLNIWDSQWLLFVLLLPLVFGSLGALLGQSPILTATIERLRSGSSLR
jgi:hypothetical protein